MNRFWIYVLIGALAVNLSAGWFYGFDKPMESDAKLYLQIARSVADGDGYRLREGFWPDQPTMSRAPGWPLVIAGALRLQHGAESIGHGEGATPISKDCLSPASPEARAPETTEGMKSYNYETHERHEMGSGKIFGEPPNLTPRSMTEKAENGEGGRGRDEGGGQRPEDGGRRTEVRGQRPEGEIEFEQKVTKVTKDLTTKQPDNLTTSPNAALMRIVCLLLNALNAVLVFLLTFTLTRNNRMALIAGALYLFYPTALYHAVTGASEILFVTLALGGVILWQRAEGREQRAESREQRAPVIRRGAAEGGEHRVEREIPKYPNTQGLNKEEIGGGKGEDHSLWIGKQKDGFGSMVLSSIFLGLASLVRLNYVILPVVVIAIGMGHRAESREHRAESSGDRAPSLRSDAGTRRTGLLCLILFLLPVSLWVVRNYKISGEFPVLSTIGGQTFYGGNNELVASLDKNWGYWVFPDSIPGEKPMRELSATMSEREVDRYYNAKGKAYLRSNWAKIPGLLTGKLIRAYVPIPWKWTKGLIVVNAYRLLLYALIVMGAIRLWQSMPRTYRGFAVSMFGVSMITTLIFWGSARFTFAVEPVFIPLASFWAMKREKK